MKMGELASVSVCSNLRMILEVKIVDGSKVLCLLVTTGHRTLTGWFAHDTGWLLTHTHVCVHFRALRPSTALGRIRRNITVSVPSAFQNEQE